jgi:hypothetical protein
MKLTVSRSKNSETYYIQKSYRTDSGKSSTKTVERLGSLQELQARFGEEDTLAKAKEYVRELSAADKESRKDVLVKLSPCLLLKKDEPRCFNGGYLFLQKVYHELGLDKICRIVCKSHKNEYNLNEILSRLLYTRVLYPGSKLSSLEDSKRFIEQPGTELHQIYRALSLLAKESDAIQAAVYKNSLKLGRRNTQVLYYDCTNYFFESEEEGGLKQYGCSKENRPNPIVQMGMFMDMEGIPLAFCINPGNTNEQVTLKPLEQKLNDNFGISKLVVCTDCGLSSYENRKNNDVGQRAFITVQSLKKLKKHLQGWSLESEGWHIAGSDKEYDLSEVDPEEHHDTLFYKDRWTNEGGLSQRLIVTFSFKYREYLRYVRNRQIGRAEKIIMNGSTKFNRKAPNDPKRFISQTSYTPDGEIAQATSYSLNQEMITQEELFDGFYAICTDLEDDAPDIIRANAGRWIIENGFRIMKNEFEARPVYLQRDDRIQAHFLTCFLALLLYKYLEKKLNRGLNHFTPDEIIGTLTDMNFLSIAAEGYMPTYTRNDLTNALHGSAGFRTDKQIVTKKEMRSIIAQTKKIEK